MKLRGADTNLERVDDLLESLGQQLGSLERQAAQATGEVDGHVGRVEGPILHGIEVAGLLGVGADGTVTVAVPVPAESR